MEVRASRIADIAGVVCGPWLVDAVAAFWDAFPLQDSLHGREPDGASVFAKFLANQGIDVSPQNAQLCWSAMRISAAEYPFTLFQDTLNTLARLKEHGVPSALVTNNYPSEVLMPDLGLFGLALAPVVCSADVGYRKPHRLMFEAALEGLGLGPDDVIMVGDSFENDVLGAKAIGITGVLKLNGREATAEERVGADYLIDDLSQLFDLGLLG
jgi:HAD superfamily hydrolase (TIGR01549 family)